MQRRGNEPDFSEPWHRSDGVLVVEEKSFHVHKGILSMWSPVFERMFSADFREKSSSDIPLPEKKTSEIQEMLLVIYPTAKPVTGQNYTFLLALAKEYQMEQLTERCEKYLLDREKSPLQATDFLVLADDFQLKELSEQSLEMAKTLSLSELRGHQVYTQIEHESAKQLAERRFKLLGQEVATIKDHFREITKRAIMELGRQKSPLLQATDVLVLAGGFQIKELGELYVRSNKKLFLNELIDHEKKTQIEWERCVELFEQEVIAIKDKVREKTECATQRFVLALQPDKSRHKPFDYYLRVMKAEAKDNREMQSVLEVIKLLMALYADA